MPKSKAKPKLQVMAPICFRPKAAALMIAINALNAVPELPRMTGTTRDRYLGKSYSVTPTMRIGPISAVHEAYIKIFFTLKRSLKKLYANLEMTAANPLILTNKFAVEME